ncbi:terminase large subunit [Xanthobacter aminoxidans]|uniref:terminase large subunit n=1 Tax=Xanthobacter aminoxidans TaxID=186280 RepID=UPI002022F961|nr:terminase large subunit [Xanthobacter aminoxidans]
MSFHWSTACPDWEDRIRNGLPLIPFQPLFTDEAEAALAIFRELKLVSVTGSPTAGDACRQWVFDFVGQIFGAYDAATGRRLINRFLLLVSKKNGKSETAAGIMVTALIRNWRLSAEFSIIAPTVEIARNSFEPARDMIRADPELDDLLKITEATRTITHRTTNATLRVLAADSDTVAGKKSVGVLIDELWLFGKRANAENMLREATGGLASRPEGFVIALSTQGDEQPAGVFEKWLKRFRGIRNGSIIDPRSLGMLYEFPEDMLKSGAFKDPANWWMTNPNMGASVDMEFLTSQYAEDQSGGTSSLTNFFAKHLNVEVGVGIRPDGWVGAEFWLKNERTGASNVDETLTLDELLRRSEVVVVGVDGGGMDDLLGFAALGREKHTGRWLLWSKAWANRIVLERRKSEAPWILDLHAQGLLTLSDAPGPDIEEVANLIVRIDETGLLPEKGGIGVDSVGISDTINALCNDVRGFDIERIESVQQGWKLSGAIKTTERRLAAGSLQHDGGLLMRKCVGNAKTEPKGNAVIVTKAVSGTAKIDPLMALFNAAALMGENPEPSIQVPEDFLLTVI